MNQKTKLLKKAGFFATIFIFLFAGLEMKARSMYETKTDLYFHHQCFEKVKDKIEVLFLGGSNMGDSVNPRYISRKSFNLAYRGADLYYIDMRFKKFIEQAPLVEEVVIDLPFFVFGYDQGKHFLMPYAKDYFLVLGILPKSSYIIDTLLYSSTYLLHQDNFIPDLIKEKKPNPLSVMEIDHIPESTIINARTVLLANGFRYVPESKKKRTGKQMAKAHMAITDKSLFRENSNYLRNIIEICKKRNIGITLVTLPTIDSYRKSFGKSFSKLYYSTIRLILDNYPEVTYYDLSELEILNDNDFYDPAHLNYKGAKKFSMLLNSILCERRDARTASLQEINH